MRLTASVHVAYIHRKLSAMRRLSPFLSLLLATALFGCDIEPFSVVAPAFSRNSGTALVSVRVPPFSRGLIHRVTVEVTAADTGRIRTIRRNMNFPIPGGNLSTAQIVDIPIGKRRFTVAAFDTADTDGIPRFRGQADSTIFSGQTQLVQVPLSRVGGAINFLAVLDTAEVAIDSTALASLPLNSVLDILEVIPQPHHDDLRVLPLASIGLGDRLTTLEDGKLSRRLTISQIPTGERTFVAHLKDLSSNGTRAFRDTLVTVVTLQATDAMFDLTPVRQLAELDAIFNMPILPADSTVVVVTPSF